MGPIFQWNLWEKRWGSFFWKDTNYHQWSTNSQHSWCTLPTSVSCVYPHTFPQFWLHWRPRLHLIPIIHQHSWCSLFTSVSSVYPPIFSLDPTLCAAKFSPMIQYPTTLLVLVAHKCVPHIPLPFSFGSTPPANELSKVNKCPRTLLMFFAHTSEKLAQPISCLVAPPVATNFLRCSTTYQRPGGWCPQVPEMP